MIKLGVVKSLTSASPVELGRTLAYRRALASISYPSRKLMSDETASVATQHSECPIVRLICQSVAILPSDNSGIRDESDR